MLSETFADDCIDQPSITLVSPAPPTMGVFIKSVVPATPTARVAAKVTDESTPTIIKFDDRRKECTD
jgi:hypothetical protein